MKKVTGESRVKNKHQIKYQVSKMGDNDFVAPKILMLKP